MVGDQEGEDSRHGIRKGIVGIVKTLEMMLVLDALFLCEITLVSGEYYIYFVSIHIHLLNNPLWDFAENWCLHFPRAAFRCHPFSLVGSWDVVLWCASYSPQFSKITWSNAESTPASSSNT